MKNSTHFARVWLLMIGGLIVVAAMVTAGKILSGEKEQQPLQGDPGTEDWSRWQERVVFFGDSITELCDLDVFYPGLNAVNSGVSGDETGQMLGRMEEDVFVKQPDVLVILGGINDILSGEPEEYTQDNLRSIVSAVHARLKKTDILLQSVYPVAERNSLAVTSRIRSLNRWLENLAEETGCRFADVYSALCREDGTLKDGYSYDGLHPNEEGYAAAVPVIAAALREILAGRED